MKYEINEEGRIVLKYIEGGILHKIKENSSIILGSGVIDVDLHDTVKTDFENYTGNYLVGRNSQKAEDGLNFVTRRILSAAEELNLANKRVKLLELVAETNKRHPHGDMSTSNVIARLGRISDMMNPLFIAEGNFGSALNKAPSQTRYISLRMSKFASKCFFNKIKVNKVLYDVKQTVTYDGVEPVFYPTTYPYLLLEWFKGINSGISLQNVAFNFTELCEATIKLIDDPKAKINIYPDAPTPINIINKSDLKNCFDKRKFKVKMEGKYKTFTEIDKVNGKPLERYYLAITSAPVMVTPSTIMSTIESIKREGDSNGPNLFADIVDMNVEDKTDGINFSILLEYKKGADPNQIFENICKVTQLRNTIGVQCNCIRDGKIWNYTPREYILYWIDNRIAFISDFLRQSYTHNKSEALKREAFIKIKPNIKEYIEFVENSKLKDDELVKAVAKKYILSYGQARYILNQRFKDITKVNMKKLQEDYEDLIRKANGFKDDMKIKNIEKIIKKELKEGIELFGRPRMCDVIDKQKDSIVKSEDLVIIYNNEEYYAAQSIADASSIIKKNNLDYTYKILITTTTSDLIYLTKEGGCKWGVGSDFNFSPNPINYNGYIRILEPKKEKCIYLVTNSGKIKKLNITEVNKPCRVINLSKGDHLADAVLGKINKGLVVVSEDNESKNLQYTDASMVPLLKKGSAGTNIFKKAKNIDRIYYIEDKEHFFIYGASGYAKMMMNVHPDRDKVGEIPFRNMKVYGIIDLDKFDNIVFVGENWSPVVYNIDKKADIKLANYEKSLKYGSLISTPEKVFKTSKNGLYQLIRL